MTACGRLSRVGGHDLAYVLDAGGAVAIRGWRIAFPPSLLEAIPLFDTTTREIGLTGGEPTLLGLRLVELIQAFRNYLPRTALHVLSNGRRFADDAYTAAVGGSPPS